MRSIKIFDNNRWRLLEITDDQIRLDGAKLKTELDMKIPDRRMRRVVRKIRDARIECIKISAGMHLATIYRQLGECITEIQSFDQLHGTNYSEIFDQAK